MIDLVAAPMVWLADVHPLLPVAVYLCCLFGLTVLVGVAVGRRFADRDVESCRRHAETMRDLGAHRKGRG